MPVQPLTHAPTLDNLPRNCCAAIHFRTGRYFYNTLREFGVENSAFVAGAVRLLWVCRADQLVNLLDISRRAAAGLVDLILVSMSTAMINLLKCGRQSRRDRRR